MYFALDAVSSFLNKLTDDEYKRCKAHELFMTWVVARFLQARTSTEHFIGFPSLDNGQGKKLSDFVFRNAALDNANFDTVIVDSKKQDSVMRIQVKRYMNRNDPTTDDLFNYIRIKAARYGHAPELSLIFHVHQNMKFNVNRFRKLAQECSFTVGAIWVFVELTSMRQKCALFEVHPQLSQVWWSPSKD